ncbi:MAG: retropepsin-like aspartic protease [Mangrovibacterium sp.]
MIVLSVEFVELEENNFHMLLESELADGEKVSWIVDTGASKTVFDSRLEAYYCLEETVNAEQYQSAGISVGMVETRVGNIARIRFGRLKIKDMKVALIDLSHVNEIYRKYGDVRIGGLLGSDVLKAYGCCIDYRRGTVSFENKRVR